MSKIRTMSIYDNLLSSSIPTEFGLLSSLEVLELHNNALTGTIPAELSSLGSLEKLNLEDNLFTGEIPRGLDAAEEIHLGGNQFSGMAPPHLCSRLLCNCTTDVASLVSGCVGL